ncbi:MAG TPA: hypothetical protein VK735_48065 [Pseudonocardia sp.]|uniref:hypothetical protein n=1 Tax=Pseudonocardia sp. TaxID=60912 RepID=UPI002BA4F52C|nr:hypothetical protein [Pseudonocardia sp.]HTF55251.1 hypothetical protein [Pseudonocardia sp.]
MSIRRAEIVRRLDAISSEAYGNQPARNAMVVAGWVDTAILWLSWRLRPKTMPHVGQPPGSGF